MRTLETTYRVRGEQVTVVTEPLRTRKATHAKHTKRCKLAVQMLYGNAAPAWLAELQARPNWPPLPPLWGCPSLTPPHRAKQVERIAQGLGMSSVRLPLKPRWVG